MPETETPVLLPPKATWDDVKAATASGVVRLQSIIEKNFKARTEPVKHDKTAVLLLHWDKKACDMDVSGEVHIFLSRFLSLEAMKLSCSLALRNIPIRF